MSTYVESNAPPSVEEIIEDELNDLVKSEIMLRIARRVGLNTNPKTPLSLWELNAVYAFLTGEHYYEKRLYQTSQSPPIGEVRLALAEEAPIPAYDTSILEDAENGEYDPEEHDRPNPYTRVELIQLAARVETTPDQRPRS